MPYRNRKSSYNNFILIFVFVKIALNALAISNFGFHRDELLHLALGDHLDWGYKEVPPFIAVIAKLSTLLFGNSVAAARIFTTLCSALVIWLTGKITVEFGGKMFAIALACLAMIFSPAFIGTGYLFQPVVFDQLWWVLTVWLLLKYLNTNAVKYLYFIGLTIGVGILTKYTMVFFAAALIAGLLITKQRRVLWNKHVLGAILVTFIVVLPNIIWQFQHHLPVFTHMAALRKSQLAYIKPIDFILQQLMANGIALFLWIAGFIFLLISFKLRKFQFLAFAFVLIFAFMLQMGGKIYYLFGAYPMLFAAGAFGFERWLKSSYVVRGALLIAFTVPSFLIFPMVLPILPINQTLAFFDYTNKHTRFLKFITVWEDHKHHATSQDYGDMFGWEEMTRKIADTYNKLTPEQKKHTLIYADNYGEAGAIHHFGKQYNLPEVISLNSSFTLWAPDELNAQYIIYVDDGGGQKLKRFETHVDTCRQVGEVNDPLAVEKGTAILLLTNPKPEFNEGYKKELAMKRLE
ncbi:MAG: hypothetical protein JWQ79_3854 [Mucilaginibacter sp.]|nr:hypothetical protein [Mucilaginibacter sp.]